MRIQAIQQHPRFPASFPVEVVGPDGCATQLRLDDVSNGGVFVRTRAPAPPGTPVQLRIAVDDSRPPLFVPGRVVHVLAEHDALALGRCPGMGVAFEAPPKDAVLVIERLTSALGARHAPTPDVQDVLAAARAVRARIRRGDAWGALQLSACASARDVTSRTTQIARLFTAAIAGASPGQRTELAKAAQAVRDLQRTLLQRIDDAQA